MQKDLEKHYLRLVVPAAVLTALAAVAVYWFGFCLAPVPAWVGVAFIAASALIGLIAPLWYKLAFVGKMKNQTQTSPHDFFAFEKNFLNLALAALYLPPAAILLNLAQWGIYTVVLIALYDAYFFFPSKKRIDFEKKIFRVK